MHDKSSTAEQPHAQTPSDTPRIDAAKAGIQSAHDAGQLTYESMLFQMVGKLSAEGRTLERELTAAESALAEERSERVGLSCKLTDWTRRCEAAERDCITFRERAEAAESALEGANKERDEYKAMHAKLAWCLNEQGRRQKYRVVGPGGDGGTLLNSRGGDLIPDGQEPSGQYTAEQMRDYATNAIALLTAPAEAAVAWRWKYLGGDYWHFNTDKPKFAAPESNFIVEPLYAFPRQQDARSVREAPIGEVVIGPKGDVEGWTVVRWIDKTPPVGTKLYAAPSTDIAAMVDRFLAWPLPESVCADLCASDPAYKSPRCGTNLLTADEARQMLEHILAAHPAEPAGKGA